MRLVPILPAILALFGAGPRAAEPVPSAALATVWDADLTDIDGRPHPLAQHRGKVLLIVNVASKCGFTGQYAGLEALHAGRRGRGLVLIGVPSNDFGVVAGQEPGSEAEIKAFCTTTYGVTFPMMAKAAVKGDGAIPLYRWLTSRPGCTAVSWNFNKFLVARDGAGVRQFGSRVKPDDPALLTAIDAALDAR
jgi:glutathione peroxidase